MEACTRVSHKEGWSGETAYLGQGMLAGGVQRRRRRRRGGGSPIPRGGDGRGVGGERQVVGQLISSSRLAAPIDLWTPPPWSMHSLIPEPLTGEDQRADSRTARGRHLDQSNLRRPRRALATVLRAAPCMRQCKGCIHGSTSRVTPRHVARALLDQCGAATEDPPWTIRRRR